MTALTTQQLYCLRQHLREVGTQKLLIDELVDHLACQAEELMSTGIDFEQALTIIRLEATALSVRHFQHTLIRQGALPQTSFWRYSSRFTKRERAAFGIIQPVRSTLLIGAFLSVILTGWLLASQGSTIPAGLVATLFCPLLLLLFLQGLRSTGIYRHTSLVGHPMLREDFILRPSRRKNAPASR